jgi:hypothetical protein
VFEDRLYVGDGTTIHGIAASVMTAADKAKLDAATSSSAANTLMLRDGDKSCEADYIGVSGIRGKGGGSVSLSTDTVYFGSASDITIGAGSGSANGGNIYIQAGVGYSVAGSTVIRAENGLDRLQVNQGGTTITGKVGFFGTTPIAKPSSTTDLRQAMINLGLYTSGGATPLDLNGGNFRTDGGTVTCGTCVHHGGTWQMDGNNGFRMGSSRAFIFSSTASYGGSPQAFLQYSTTNTIKLVTSLNGSTGAHLQMGTLNSVGPQYTGAPASAPTDANIANNQISAYLDESGGNLKFRIRKSDGTYKTATLAMT